MTLLAVERIKLLSTRSPWWSTFVALALTIGFAVMAATRVTTLTLAETQLGYQFGLMVVMVMAALAVTTEYRFSTIKVTFQAVPNRTAVLLAKTGIVAVAALLVGEIAAFGSWAAAQMVAPASQAALNSADAWRVVAGVGPVFMVGAVIALAVGILLRHSAAAVAVILIWPLLVEQLVAVIPDIGPDIQKWMPFQMADHFLSTGGFGVSPYSMGMSMPLGPWASLGYFAATGAALLTLALVVAHRRDA